MNVVPHVGCGTTLFINNMFNFLKVILSCSVLILLSSRMKMHALFFSFLFIFTQGFDTASDLAAVGTMFKLQIILGDQ